MEKAKFAGGLGFRELESFNMALLAKQGFRIIQRPEALASKILKLKYFPHSSFFDARIGSNLSYIWRRIHAAKNLVEEGSLWRVGNGAHIRIWRDRWLPQPSSFQIQSPVHILGSEAIVADLVDPRTRSWNTSLIDAVFNSYEVETVKKIPLSIVNCPNKIIWRCSNNGMFFVKSAYHLQMEMVEREKGQGSNSNANKSLWVKLWKLNIPNAAKVFVWRACLESLPTKDNLFRRKIVESSACPLCLINTETVVHVLWDCPAAKDVWSDFSMKVQKSSFTCTGFMQLLIYMDGCLEQELLEKFLLTAKKIWQRRNLFIFEEVFIHPKKVLQQAQQLLTDFHDSKVSQHVSRGPVVSNNSNWTPPPLDVYKVGDAAIKQDIGKVGIGIVIRDFEGRVVATRRMQKFMFTDAFTAKSQGVLQAVCFAKEIGLRRIILQGDALNVVNSLKSDSSEFHYSGVLLWDAKSILSHFVSWDIVHVRRHVNMAAHVLAKYGLSSDEDEVRLEDSHSCIIPFI